MYTAGSYIIYNKVGNIMYTAGGYIIFNKLGNIIYIKVCAL